MANHGEIQEVIFCENCGDSYTCLQAGKCQLHLIDLTWVLPKKESAKREGTGVEIYNLLLAGEKLRLTFPNLLKAREFRNYLATVKSRQDRIYVGAELIGEEEVSVLRMEVETVNCMKEHAEYGACLVIFYFSQEKKRKAFTYEILPRNGEGDA